MRTTRLTLIGVLAATAAIGTLIARDAQTTAPPATQSDQTHTADREAIKQSAREFEKAFEKGDAKTVAAFWTDNGEVEDADGVVLRGRAEIEKAYTEFFAANPKQQLEVMIESIRFPAPNVAIEEGLMRQSGAGKQLPSTTLFSAIHYRDKDGWKIATSREWGADRHRLEDLEWLISAWKAHVGNDDVTLTFAKEQNKPHIKGEFVRKSKDILITAGFINIRIDPQNGQLRSWHFDDDGGHGQSLWLRDGSSWVMDYVGTGSDGLPHESVNIISRLSNNEITWRSIDRVVNGQPLPDLPPVKLTREQPGK